MDPYESGSSSSTSYRNFRRKGPVAKGSEIDGHLAGAGYNVKSSDLVHVAKRLEQLETVMFTSQQPGISHLSSDTVHYNPSDLVGWVESMLVELNPAEIPAANPLDIQPAFPDFPDLRFLDEFSGDGVVPPFPGSYPPPNPAPPVPQAKWVYGGEMMENWCGPDSGNSQQSTTTTVEEDSGIQLVHLLMKCAEAVQRGDVKLASKLIQEMRVLSSLISSVSGFGKVAGYFIDGLSRRLYSSQAVCADSAIENEILYHNFYEACPYLKFAHFTANQAILEAFEGHDSVHVIDFSLMHGLQWPALIQALALRPGGPPLLRITGIGPPSPDGRDTLREIGLKLADLANSVHVCFSFRGVAAERLDDVKPWMLEIGPQEVIAVNSVMQLHRLLYSDPIRGSPIDSVLKWLRELNPKIMTVVEQEANHNQPGFSNRFIEALHYYSTMFDSLEACSLQLEKAVTEMYIHREICNIICCEGSARVERHEPLDRWRYRFSEAGFKPLHLGSNAFKQASMLLTLFSAEGYNVEENSGCLTLGWHNRPLIAASAWQAVPFQRKDEAV